MVLWRWVCSSTLPQTHNRLSKAYGRSLLCRYTNTYPLCLSLLEQGAINCEPLITHRYGFSADEVAKGFDTAVNAKVTKSIKVMFHL